MKKIEINTKNKITIENIEGFVNVDNIVREEKLISAVKRTGYNVTKIRFEEKNEGS